MAEAANQIEAADAPEWGPAMQALPEKRRMFVLALYDEESPAKGAGLLIWAARKANYGTETSSNKSLSVIAARLVNDARVRAAMAEHLKSVVHSIAPDAVRAIRDLIKNPKARDHARALAMVLDRADPVEQKQTLTIQDQRPVSPDAIDRVLKRIDELMARVGLPVKQAPVIDAVIIDGDAA